MEKPVHEENYKGLTIKIYADDNGGSPKDWGDDGLFLVADHRDFSVNGPKKEKPSACIEIYGKTHHVFGLEAYIHSGVVLALSREGNFPDRQWDVSQLGAVFVSKKEFRLKKSARKCAQGLIETWNDYLSGNVYGYNVETEEGSAVDSVWGFYGDYDKEGGALLEARSAANYHVKNNPTPFIGAGI